MASMRENPLKMRVFVCLLPDVADEIPERNFARRAKLFVRLFV
jgi:hypothetical protein